MVVVMGRCWVFPASASDLPAAWSTNQCQTYTDYQSENIFMGRFWKVSVDAEIFAKTGGGKGGIIIN